MLSPSELKKRQFSRALRGYSPTEVDEHIAFILEKYAELYRRNDELEKELARLQTEYEQLKASEDAIRRAMVNAQREERKIIDEANDRAGLILRTAKLNSDRILADFKGQIREERVILYKLRRAVREFKENTLKQYQMHLEFLNQISPDLPTDDPALEMTEDDYANSLLEQMKIDIERGAVAEDLPDETPPPVRRSKSAPPAPKGDFPEDKRMRTAIFESIRGGKKIDPEASTKEIPLKKKKNDKTDPAP